MKKIAVVYWSGTGNTKAMADAIVEGATSAGSDVSVFGPTEFTGSMVADFDAIAFGCPAMGAEVLEEEVFEPMFTSVESQLSGKRIALFGSYGWGDGQWMRDWEDRCKASGAQLITDSVMANETPNDDALSDCRALGSAL